MKLCHLNLPKIILDKVKGVFGIRSASEEHGAVDMAGNVTDRVAQSVGSNFASVVHCGGRGNIDAVTRGRSIVLIQNQQGDTVYTNLLSEN